MTINHHNHLIHKKTVALSWLRHRGAQLFLHGAAICSVGLSSLLHAQSVPPAAPPGPQGGQVMQGSATINYSGGNTHITNTPGTVINWQSFNVPAGSSTYFQQQNSQSSVLNQVISNNPSQIFGTLGSNGRVILVNQSGIVVGAGAVVDTAGFLASTLKLQSANADLSQLKFGAEAGQPAGSLRVDGMIRSSNGDIVLIAPDIQTGGNALIKAENGSVMLAAGQQVSLLGRGLDGIVLEIQAPTDRAINLGRIEGNAVGLFASQLRHSGHIEATTATLEGGRVILRAQDTLTVTGVINAIGSGSTARGGTITLEANQVALQGANLNASGTTGGGEIKIGGGWQGNDASMRNSLRTYVDGSTTINASALQSGNGGTVVVWADKDTWYSGLIVSTGGALSGNGGKVEISGKQRLQFDGRVNLRAPNGQMGSVLLDPQDILIVASGGTTSIGNFTSFSNCGNCTLEIDAAALQNALQSSSVLLQATNDILVNTSVSWSATTDLLLVAGRSVFVLAPITSTGGGSIFITANSDNMDASLGRGAGAGAILMTDGISAGSISTSSLSGSAGAVSLVIQSGASGPAIAGGIQVGNIIADDVRLHVQTGIDNISQILNTQITAGNEVLMIAPGGIGGDSSVIQVNTPRISLASSAGSVYVNVQNGSGSSPVHLAPSAALGGMAADVSGLLSITTPYDLRIGSTGNSALSGNVSAGILRIGAGQSIKIFSDSTANTSTLQVSATTAFLKAGSFYQTAVGDTSMTAPVLLHAGAGGLTVTGNLSVLGGTNFSDTASVTSDSDISFVANSGVDLSVIVIANGAQATLQANSSTGVISMDGSEAGFVRLLAQGGGNELSNAVISAGSISVIGCKIDIANNVSCSDSQTIVAAYGGAGLNATGSVIASNGAFEFRRNDSESSSIVMVGGTGVGSNALISANGLISATLANIVVQGDQGNARLVGGDIFINSNGAPAANNVTVVGGNGTNSFAEITSSGAIDINALSVDVNGGVNPNAYAQVTANQGITLTGNLTLQGGYGADSFALVSTTGSVSVGGTIGFNLSNPNPSLGSHAVIYAQANSVTLAISNGNPVTTLTTGLGQAAALGIIVPSPDLSATVSLPANATAGDTVGATIVFSNPSAFTLTFTPTLSINGASVTLAPVTLSPNTTLTTTQFVLVTASGATVTVNTGSSSLPEINVVNNVSTAVTSIALPQTDFSSVVIVPPNALAGSTATTTVTIANIGATGATVTITIVAGTQTITTQTFIAAGGSVSIPVAVTIGFQNITVSSAVTSTVADTNFSNNNSAQSISSLSPIISSTVALPSTGILGQTVSGTVTFTNNGNATTTFVAVIDGAGGVANTQTLSLAPNAGLSIPVVVTVSSGINTITSGVLNSSVPQSNTSANASLGTVLGGNNDISTTISLPPTAVAGLNTNATITYTNLGSFTNVVTTTVVINGVPMTSSFTLAPGASFTTVTVVPVGINGATVSNSISSSLPDSSAANNGASASVIGAPGANPSVSILAPGSTIPGTAGVVTVTVSNPGVTTATNVVAIVTLPTGATTSISFGTLSAGASVVQTLSYSVGAGSTGSATASVAIISSSPDANSGDNTAASVVMFTPKVNFGLSANPVTLTGGVNTTIPVTVVNTGPSVASGTLSFVFNGTTQVFTVSNLAPGGSVIINCNAFLPAGSSSAQVANISINSLQPDLNVSDNAQLLSLPVFFANTPPAGLTNFSSSNIVLQLISLNEVNTQVLLIDSKIRIGRDNLTEEDAPVCRP
jgi:filamentous hemagglutinin family protein